MQLLIQGWWISFIWIKHSVITSELKQWGHQFQNKHPKLLVKPLLLKSYETEKWERGRLWHGIYQVWTSMKLKKLFHCIVLCISTEEKDSKDSSCMSLYTWSGDKVNYSNLATLNNLAVTELFKYFKWEWGVTKIFWHQHIMCPSREFWAFSVTDNHR